MRKDVRPILGAAMRMVFCACGAGLSLAAASHAAAATPKADKLASRAAKGDKLTPATSESTVAGHTPTSRTGGSIPVDSITARPVEPLATTTTAVKKQPGYLPRYPLPKTFSSTPKPKPDPDPAPATAKEEAPGEIQWSSRKSGSGMKATGATARTVELTVPLRDGNFYLGDVAARIAPGDRVSVPRDRLLKMIAPILRPAALDTLKNLSAPEGHLPLATIKSAGFDIVFDSGKVEMTINPTIEQRATGRLSAGHKRDQVISENLSAPAIFASYLNMRAGADYATHSFYDGESTANARVGFDGATRWMDIVLESSATFDMEGGFSRGSSRFVYDMPDEALRFSAGDVSPPKARLQGGSDLLGVSVEKSYQKLQPAASIHPTGSQSFRIERPSNVDVVINGHVSRRLHLRPGDYDMSDLPLSAGANDISLVIEDNLGNKRTLNFSVFSGRSLLAPGVSEWALSAGVASRYNSGGLKDFHNLYSGLEYDFSTPVVTGFYERGLTPDLTGSVHFQADPDAMMGGTGAAFQTAFGFFDVEAAASNSFTYGAGFAANIGYELANIEGADGIRRSFRLAIDYRSEKFAPVSVADPCNDTMLSLSAAYSQQLPWELSGSLSGNYSIGRGDDGDRYGVDVSLGRSFGPYFSAGLTAGYADSSEPRSDSGLADGFKAALRLNYRLGAHSSIDAGHDARTGNSQISYRHQEGSGIGSWSTQVELDRSPGLDGGNDHYSVNGSASYTANRAELSVSQHTGLAGLDVDSIDQRTSITAGTAIAFADGRVAVGRPISSGFAIINPHNNLAESEVSAGSADAKRASSGLLGPALLSDVSPYSPSRVSIDVSNLPVGYDLGSGAFDLYPGYKSGYLLTVGSDYTVTAFGTIMDAEGKPVTLLTGEAYEEGQPQGRKVTIFTNRAGKFGAQGLRPGRWVVDMATEPSKTRYVLEIPEKSVGLVKLGTLKPAGRVQ